MNRVRLFGGGGGGGGGGYLDPLGVRRSGGSQPNPRFHVFQQTSPSFQVNGPERATLRKSFPNDLYDINRIYVPIGNPPNCVPVPPFLITMSSLSICFFPFFFLLSFRSHGMRPPPPPRMRDCTIVTAKPCHRHPLFSMGINQLRRRRREIVTCALHPPTIKHLCTWFSCMYSKNHSLPAALI